MFLKIVTSVSFDFFKQDPVKTINIGHLKNKV